MASCKHDRNKEKERASVQTPELKLERLLIHGVPVMDDKIELKTDQIMADDVEAHFSYGSVTDEEIQVTVKD